MTADFGSLPGRSGYETNQRILHDYGNGGATDPLVLTVTLPPGTTVDSPGIRAELATAFGGAVAAVGDARLISYPGTGDRALVSADGRSTFALLYPPAAETYPPYAEVIPRLNQALSNLRVAGAPVGLTGTDALFVQSSDATGPGLLTETVLAGGGALLVLAVVFGSVLAVVPLVMAVIAILVTFLAVLGVTTVTDVSFVVQFLVGLIGLGVAIDYALLITTRWREERAACADNTEAIERTMVTAGAAVVFSGITVAIALAALILLPVPFLRSIGYGGLLIGLISVLVAVTLLPVLLATAGSRLEWPRRRPIAAADPHGATGAPDGRRWGWHGWSRLVVRHPVPVAVVATALLGALIVPVFDMRLGAPVPASIAASGPARQALDSLGAAGIGAGVLSPDYVLTGPDPAAVTERARSAPGVRAAFAPDGDSWRLGGTSLVVVLFDEPDGSAAGRAARDGFRATMAGVPDARIGGVAAQGRDFVAVVYGNAAPVLSMIALVTLVLLIRAFRSVLLAAKAVALNVLSVAATFGLTVLAWQEGYLSGAVWGIEGTGALTEWVPVMVFGFLFGLSMDYEVFILARVREEYDATASTPRAAALGVARTGRLVTSGALILFLVFVSLAATPGTEVKIFATALGLGILLDATVVRAMLVPALVVLFGRWNWWLPRSVARILAMRTPRPAAAVPVPRRAAARFQVRPCFDAKDNR